MTYIIWGCVSCSRVNICLACFLALQSILQNSDTKKVMCCFIVYYYSDPTIIIVDLILAIFLLLLGFRLVLYNLQTVYSFFAF